jgi:hypothetical protein
MAAIPHLGQAIHRRPTGNPYVGPRAFREKERLYGRDQELAELADLLVAERVVLMYSPSGAGKTSLIQASLVPDLRRQRFRPLPPARVNLLSTGKVDGNRYALSVLLSLESKLRPPNMQRALKDLSTVSLSEYLQMEAERKTAPPIEGIDRGMFGNLPLVLIIDQFEEILLLDPADQAGQATFFSQLGDAIEEQRLWVLLSMREEYMGGLDKFSYELPTSLSVRYRLDLLKTTAARSAIQGPPMDTYGVTVSDKATDLLLRNLSTILLQRPGELPTREDSPYVEGVMLQTVSRRLWEEIDPLGRGLKKIEPKHLGDLKHVDRALAQFYSDAVTKASRSAKLGERLVRDWFEDVLITEQGFRSQTDVGPGNEPRKAIRCLQVLERQHLVRSEPRLNRPWYELVHDRFIDPIRRDNSAWRLKKGYGEVARGAKEWRRGRSPQLLLTGETLKGAILWLSAHEHDAYDYEREFIEESTRVQSDLEKKELDRIVAEQREAIYQSIFADLTKSRLRWQLTALSVFVLCVLILIAVVLRA